MKLTQEEELHLEKIKQYWNPDGYRFYRHDYKDQKKRTIKRTMQEHIEFLLMVLEKVRN